MKLKKIINDIISHHLSENNHIQKFKKYLSNLNTFNFDDDQIQFPSFNPHSDHFLFQLDQSYFHIRNSTQFPNSGPFELFILDINDHVIGFIRGTTHKKIISFNLIYIIPENRREGIGFNLYTHFLNNNYTIKSDSEITDDTYFLYLKLLNNNFSPIIFHDNTVGFKK